MAPSAETRNLETYCVNDRQSVADGENHRDDVIDVLIVGAGPAGLMLAACAAHAGLRIRVVDSGHASHHERGRGDALQCRTIEVLRMVGVGQEIIDQGVKMFARTFWDTSQSKPECISRSSFFSPTFDIDDCYSLGVRQGVVEDALRRKLYQTDSTQVDYGWSFVDAELEMRESHDSSVVVRLESEYGDAQTIRARYMVGCDGGRSAVRRWLRSYHGILLEGDSHDSRWAAVDVIGVETDFPDIRNLSILHGTTSTVLVIPRESIDGQSCVRLYCQLPDMPLSIQEPASSDVTTLQQVLHVVNDTFSPFKIRFQHVHWFTVYTVSQRLVSALDVQGRIFLAGDAAHLHSPKGGLGMNTSLMDAHNLALKLALVEKHGMPASLLTTYNLERRMVAEQLINMDRDLIQFFARHQRQQTIHNKGKDDRGSKYGGNTEQENALAVFQRRNEAYQSGVSILYPRSQLVGTDQSDSCAAANALHDQQPAESRLAWLLSSAGQAATTGAVCGPFGLFAGARLLPATVTRWKDCNPISVLELLAFADARFTVFACTGLLPTSEILGFLKHVARPGGLHQQLRSKHPASEVQPDRSHLLPGLLDPHRPVLQLVGITMHSHVSMQLAASQTDLCCYSTRAIDANVVQFNPDWWMCDDRASLSPYPDQMGKPSMLVHPAHEKWRVDPNRGALVVVRPDSHVALVTSSIYEWKAVEEFFASLLPGLA